MAIVNTFDRVERVKSPRATIAEGGYYFAVLDGVEYLVLETYGPSDRKLIGKASQVLHLNRTGATALKALLEERFPGL